MKILLAYVSMSSSCSSLGSAISSDLIDYGYSVDSCRIIATEQHDFSGWLLRSLVPGFKVDIRPTIEDASRYDSLVLISPNWGCSCPPFSTYLDHLIGLNAKNVNLIVVRSCTPAFLFLVQVRKILFQKGAVNVLCNSVHKSKVLNGSYLHRIQESLPNSLSQNSSVKERG